MNETIPNIFFDSNGICSYCHINDKMEKEYPLDGKQSDRLKIIVDKIKEDSKDKKYDCVIGVSGGCDSSLILCKMKEFGLRALAVTFDNTWSTDISTNNISNMCEKLNIDLYTYVVNGEEFNDISRSFLYASVPDADVPNDIAITKLYYKMMDEYNVDYFICGHSFRTEGTVPLGWTYMDGRYIESVHKEFGTIPMSTYLNLDIDYWLKNINKKRIRLLYYIDYKKEETKEFLINNFGWKWYGGHHCENDYTKFIKNYLLPQKFNIDKRYVEFSALVRSKQMDREKALLELQKTPEIDQHFIKYVLKRLKLTTEEFDKIMKLPIKSYKDYETYRQYFVDNREKFKEMFDKGLIPLTFYEKYCKE
jgi:N-acetyl sugar amidotransferase